MAIIKTKRLELIPFERSDKALFHRINTDPFIRKYLWDDEIIAEEKAAEIIDLNEEHFKRDHYGLWKIRAKENNNIIGYAGLWHFFDEDQPQLMYALLKDFTKKGFAKEASEAIIDYAFNKLGFKYIIAATDSIHRESQNVALSLGMTMVEERLENEKPTLFFRLNNATHLDQ
ncbi:GNAT family N-acetyltransferase [Hyphobacterium sp. CCMP332]|nr:GNAT family N-acetyltransferase [Hyphobacterium sp. CCMP332]